MQFVENATQTRVFSNSNNLNLRRMRGTQLTERCHSLEFVGLGAVQSKESVNILHGRMPPGCGAEDSSDIRLATLLLGQKILPHVYPLRERSICSKQESFTPCRWQ